VYYYIVQYDNGARVVCTDEVPHDGYIVIQSMKCSSCHQYKKWCYYGSGGWHICGTCFEAQEMAKEREITL
jgi:hypothetical protein